MAVILLNIKACGGRALQKWESIESELRTFLGEFVTIIADDYSKEKLAQEISHGEKFFIAAGGDGTVNFLLNSLAQCTNGTLANISIGAIGLGSSNDFHKPFLKNQNMRNIPCKIARETAELRTIGSIKWSTGNISDQRLWINNASVGVTSEGNDLFNHPGRFLHWLKQVHTDTAILFTAVSTILDYQNLEMMISANGAVAENTLVTNLGVIFNPHFSGSFHYDTPHLIDSDFFFVHTIKDQRMLSTLQMLVHLTKGKFQGLPHTNTIQASQVSLQSRNEFAVEFDGETIRTNNVEFTLKQKAIKICK